MRADRPQPLTGDRPARLTAALAAAGVSGDQVLGSRSLAGGTFNAVHLVRLADGTRLVVKIPPAPGVLVLRYEQGLLATEALYYRLASECPGVTVPAVIAADADTGSGGYLVGRRRFAVTLPRPAAEVQELFSARRRSWMR